MMNLRIAPWHRMRWWGFHRVVQPAFRREFQAERQVLVEQAILEVIQRLSAILSTMPPEARHTRRHLWGVVEELTAMVQPRGTAKKA